MKKPLILCVGLCSVVVLVLAAAAIRADWPCPPCPSQAELCSQEPSPAPQLISDAHPDARQAMAEIGAILTRYQCQLAPGTRINAKGVLEPYVKVEHVRCTYAIPAGRRAAGDPEP